MSRVELTHDPIDPQTLSSEMHSHDAGAVVTFAGMVRAEESDGKTLTALDYEAYKEMALEQMQTIRKRAGEKFEILDAAIVHRLGKLNLGETSIAVVVVSPHRAAAFDACRWILDTVKTDVPIWKKDIWADGTSSWVTPT